MIESKLKRLSLMALGMAGLIAVGCGDLKEYRADSLNLSVVRLDPQLENRWGSEGVVVESASAESGLLPGDLITHLVTRTEVSSGTQLLQQIELSMAPRKRFWEFGSEEESDATALLEIDRNGETLYIELATRDASEWDEHGAAFSGVSVSSVTDGYEDALSISPAAAAGLTVGDTVLAVIDENATANVEAFRAVAQRVKQPAQVYVYTHELTGIKLEAIRAIGRLGGGEDRALNRLLEIMETDDDPAIRRTAAGALASLAESQTDGRLLEAMLPHLAQARESDVEIRRSAATIVETLATVLPNDTFSDNAIQTIAAAMNDSDPGVHFKAGVILSKLGERTLPALTTALGSASSTLARDIAASALGDIGGAPARSALIAALGGTDDVTLQLTIATALSKIGDATARQELQALLDRTENSGVREFVRQLLDASANAMVSRH